MSATGTAVTLAGLLRTTALAAPQRAATVLPRGRRHRAGAAGFRTTTYAELDRRVDAVGAGLLSVGIGPQVRTALMVPPTEDFFALAFALLRIGAVPVLIDPGIGRRHLRACLGEAAPSAFIGIPRAHAARRALGWCPTARVCVTVGAPVPGRGTTLRALERRGRSRQPLVPTPPPPDAVAAIAYTSGSTGVPKGVEYRAANLAAQVRLIRGLYDIEPGEFSVATFPPFALLGPAMGLTTVIPRMDPTRPARIDPRRLVDAVDTFGASLLFGSPALLDTVSRWAASTGGADGPGRPSAGGQLPSLRRVISAGAPVPRSVQRRTLAMLGPGAEVFTPYGATEALPVTSIGSAELLGLPAGGICVGRPVPGVDVVLIRVTDEPLSYLQPGLEVDAGQVGEVVVRGPVVTERYLDRPAATAAAKLDWDGQVAHRMGDLAYRDAEGRLWFCGRKADRVRTPGGTLFSVPCEEVFHAHPAVARSALVGLGRPPRQRPVICIELERPARPTRALTAELLALAAGHTDTAPITTMLYHPGFPVDIRHNSKIDREALARWAARRA